jgi:competence protein ComGF
MIQLNQSRELEFRGDGTRKMLFHNETFNAKNEEDMLICFKIKAHSKRVPVYKFGICDEQYKEFKDAYISLFLKYD